MTHPPIKCPKGMCTIISRPDDTVTRTSFGMTKHKIKDCGNYGSAYCPISEFPWYYDEKFRKYPSEWAGRQWSEDVWRRGAKKYGYDPDQP
jgi:hypothetical protein